MTIPMLETERLVFRPFTADDLNLVVDLHSDPQVQRYLGGTWSEQDFQHALDGFVRQQAEYGHAKWAVFLRDGTFVGRAGVGHFPPLTRAGLGGSQELGYCFKTAHWGQGFATEAARALVDWFFANSTHDRLFGFTEAGHAVSQRILLKLGMAPVGRHNLGFKKPSEVFRLDRTDRSSRSSSFEPPT